MAEVSVGRHRVKRGGLDLGCESSHGQQRNNSGGCTTMGHVAYVDD